MNKLIEILKKFNSESKCDVPNCKVCFIVFQQAVWNIKNLLQSKTHCRYCGAKFILDKEVGMYHHKDSDCTISQIMFTKEGIERRV